MAEELTLRNVNRLSTQQLRAELSKRNIDPDPENAGSGTKRPKSEDIISFQPGLLIKIQNIPLAYNCSSSSDVSIKSCIKGSCGGLKFVEMLTGLCAILRFATTEEASTAYGKLSRCEIALPFDSTGTHINILSGQDEVDYWSRIAEKHSKKRNEAEIHQVLLKRLMHVLAQEEKAKLQPEQKPVMCSECQAVLSSKSALARHMRVHVGGASGDSISSESYSIQDALVMGKMSFITVFEDDYMKVIVKPQGIATMGAKGEITVLTSDELLLSPTSRLYSSKYKKAVPVHRLDKLTGGLLVCSKTKVSERFLKQCFQNRLVGKKYRAICPGEILPREGVIDIPIGGKESITTYSVSHVTRSERFGWLTTVDLWPTTGRTHQLYEKFLFLCSCYNKSF